mgnify:CR=1 FL=1
MDSLHGRAAIGWMVVQDLVTIILIALLEPLAGGGSAAPVLFALVRAAAFMALAYIVGTRLLPWLFQTVSRLGSPELFLLSVFATALLARGLFDELKVAQGSIVNVTSIAGGKVHPFAGVAYATSKAALAALTREMAHDFGPHGVRCNAIAPGEIDTAILSPGTNAIVDKEIPMKRLGKPSEVAQLIYFLCTSQSSYVTGAEIHINGGEHV